MRLTIGAEHLGLDRNHLGQRVIFELRSDLRVGRAYFVDELPTSDARLNGNVDEPRSGQGGVQLLDHLGHIFGDLLGRFAVGDIVVASIEDHGRGLYGSTIRSVLASVSETCQPPKP